MPLDKPGANVLDPPSNKTGDPKSDEGKIPRTEKSPELLEAEKGIENIRKENETLKSRLESVEEMQAELEELREERKLTIAEKARLEQLRKVGDDIEAKLAQIEANPEAKPWWVGIDRRIDKKLQDSEDRGKTQASEIVMESFVHAKAAENKMDYKKFRSELADCLPAKMMDELPHIKAEAAYQVWQSTQNFKKREAELIKREAELNGTREDGSRKPRETTFEEAKASNDIQGMKKHLGL